VVPAQLGDLDEGVWVLMALHLDAGGTGGDVFAKTVG
jgi:hypothetical protein